MSESFLNGRVTLHCGDCLDVLATLPENSIDSCVTDPPYHLVSIVKRFGKPNSAPVKLKLTDSQAGSPFERGARGFMGKEWDGGDIAQSVDLWSQVYRVLKPGAHLLAFGGTRTYHRMACAIEDAGFEIRDCIQWLYGSGFPKSHDVSKGIDRAAGVEREIIGPSHYANRGARLSTEGSNDGYKRPAHINNARRVIEAPATDAARQWQGWGTALKPACEPIVLARKPLSERTVAANVLKWGTGALNIDGCRVEATAGDEPLGWERPRGGIWKTNSEATAELITNGKGRWPANVILSIPEDEYILRGDTTPEQKRDLYRWMSENS